MYDTLLLITAVYFYESLFNQDMKGFTLELSVYICITSCIYKSLKFTATAQCYTTVQVAAIIFLLVKGYMVTDDVPYLWCCISLYMLTIVQTTIIHNTYTDCNSINVFWQRKVHTYIPVLSV